MIEQQTEPQAEQQEAGRGGLTIEHTDDEGTTIDGTSRGDGTAEVLKVNGWRWSRTLFDGRGSWYVPRSRNVPPKRFTIDRTVAALEAAGFIVAVLIDAPPGDREASRFAGCRTRRRARTGSTSAPSVTSRSRPTATPQPAASRT